MLLDSRELRATALVLLRITENNCGLTNDEKIFCALGIAIALAFFVSCGKQQTEAEKNAEIERQVQQRLAAEHQAEEQQKLAQREADLKAREESVGAERTRSRRKPPRRKCAEAISNSAR